MKLLLHACCVHCSVIPYRLLTEEGMDVTILWYNPNIHPYRDYKRRMDCVIDWTSKNEINLILRDEYPLEEWLENAMNPALKSRCDYCYRDRLEKTFQIVQENGFDLFSTTLLYSLYQKHGLVKKIGNEVGGKRFYYQDFRKYHDKYAIKGYYRQGYCGCIFSERDRYQLGDISLPE